MLLVSILRYPKPDGCEGSVLNVGGGYQVDQSSRNPSRSFPRLIVFWRLTTSREGTDILNNPSRDHLAQYNQSSASLSLNSPVLRDDPDSTGDNLRDMGQNNSRLNTSDGTPYRRPSRRDAPGVGAGYATGNPSRQCHTYLDLELVLNPSGIRSRLARRD